VESDIAEVRLHQSISLCRHSRQTSLHKQVLSRLLLQ
jgi:hypothetical protein